VTQRYYDAGTADTNPSAAGYYDIDGTLNSDDGFYSRVTEVQEMRRARVTRFPGEDGTGYRAGNPAKVLFEIWPKHELDDQAAFVIQFPEAQLKLIEGSTTRTCYASNANGFELDRVYCEVYAANNTIIVRNYCIVADCSDGAAVRFSMGRDFIMNYDLVVDPLDDDEHSLVIKTTTDKTYYYVD
jgi:hypothetical protein